MTQDTAGSRSLLSHSITPAGNRQIVRVENQYADANDPDRKERREKLGEEIWKNVKKIPFHELTEELDLDEKFNKFEAAAGTMFDGLANQMPRVDKNGLFYPALCLKTAVDNDLSDLSGNSLSKKERALTDHFNWLWGHMQSIAKPKSVCIPQKSQYNLIDYQNKMVPGTRLEPDGLFFHMSAKPQTFATAQIILEAKWPATIEEFPKETLGQIGDYVLRAWEEQHTRVYVPVVVLHGGHVSIMAFTRKCVFVANLGMLYSDASAAQVNNTVDIADTLRCTWFYLTLSTMELGNVCDVGSKYRNLRFYIGERPIRMEITPESRGDNIVRLGDRIKRPVKIFRRTSYMFWATLDRQPVVLKLVWTPTYCYPEGAGYKVIENDCAGLIPRVHRSGVLIPNSFGYRLEFLVIENCGITIDEYAADCRTQGMGREVFSATLVQAIRSVAT
ncbi:hypothetical protein GGF43_001514, partial [Coemansia sp. RSA 2618]